MSQKTNTAFGSINGFPRCDASAAMTRMMCAISAMASSSSLAADLVNDARRKYAKKALGKLFASIHAMAELLTSEPSWPSIHRWSKRRSASSSAPSASGWPNATLNRRIQAAVGAGAKSPASATTLAHGFAATWPMPAPACTKTEVLSSGRSHEPRCKYSSRKGRLMQSCIDPTPPPAQRSSRVICGSRTTAQRNSAAVKAQRGVLTEPGTRPTSMPGL
mmetsp:Transcript_80477/g.232556  ORF Transcript_80477/g.232556 Transcript_80477/m.232556 type:complete len:219 (-) Transcript_80477:244-900(-)